MPSFEETLFNAMLPMFERALKAANEAGTVPAAAAGPAPVATPISPLAVRPTAGMPKAA